MVLAAVHGGSSMSVILGDNCVEVAGVPAESCVRGHRDMITSGHLSVPHGLRAGAIQ